MRTTLTLIFGLLLLLSAGPIHADSNQEFQEEIQEIIDGITPSFVFIGGGSGVLISEDGYFLTNYHVATNVKQWQVTITDGRSFMARQIGVDPLGDIALLKLELKDGESVPFSPLGDSDAIEVGEYSIAVGNPFGLGNAPTTKERHPTVSMGIISAIYRYQEGYSAAIQTDTSINPGNSGGPLFNLKGEVIGINGRIATRHRHRVNTGVGYAIPSNQIARFLPEFKKRDGEGNTVVLHGSLRGLHYREDERDGKGARIDRVTSDSDAEGFGFKAEDLVVSVEGYPIFNVSRLRGVVGMYPAGSPLTVTVLRDGLRHDLEVTLSEQQRDQEWASRQFRSGGYLGVRVVDPDEVSGAEVMVVEPDSPAAAADIREGDIITAMGKTGIVSSMFFLQHMGNTKPGQKITLTVLRGEDKIQINAVLTQRPDRR
jgi:S1-C subfamily serine protease